MQVPQLDLTRFGGHVMFAKRGSHHGIQSETIHAGIPASNGRVGARWAQFRGAAEGVWSHRLVDSAVG